jgi:hypothetical protein
VNIGDVILPIVSRFPSHDLKGNLVGLEDPFLGQLATITKVDRCWIEVRSHSTGRTWVYRQDEVELYCIKEDWGTSIAGIRRTSGLPLSPLVVS